ncbi:MAG: hypothetical protein K8F59_05270 [Rhodobacteraceae bacterium]|nr:hypothetical protein [Paracoccaceae bacterium]
MSLSDRRTFVLTLAALPLAACGFKPLYSEGGAARALHGDIRFDLIESPEGFQLLESLESRLGRPGANPRYAGAITLAITAEQLILTAATSLSRITLKADASVTVTEAATGHQMFAESFRETIGYTSNTETLVTNTAERDARAKLMQALAEQITRRLAASAGDWPE